MLDYSDWLITHTCNQSLYKDIDTDFKAREEVIPESIAADGLMTWMLGSTKHNHTSESDSHPTATWILKVNKKIVISYFHQVSFSADAIETIHLFEIWKK